MIVSNPFSKIASLRATGLALLFLATPAVAQQDYSATVTETLEEPEYIPDVSPPARSDSRARTVAGYSGCDIPRIQGLTPFYRGRPGYREDMDSDGDGVACEDRPGALQEALERQRRRSRR